MLASIESAPYREGMKFSYALLAICNLLLMGLTATLGLQVVGAEGFSRHFLLGVLTGMFTCFVHIVAFMYFAVQGKIMQQAVNGGLDATHHRQTIELKARALRVSLCGIGAILVVIALGAAIGIYASPMAHLITAFACLALQGWLAVRHYILIDEYARVFQNAFGEG